MNAQKPKKVYIQLLLVLLFLIAIPILARGLWGLDFWIDRYMHRPLECPPEQLLPQLEEAFKVTFPKDISKVRACKAEPVENTVDFAVNFSSDPNSVKSFLGSFPARRQLVYIGYKPNLDSRKRAGTGHVPSWYTRPIKQGDIIEVIGSGDATIYVNRENLQEHTVYFDGFYMTVPPSTKSGD